MKWKFNFFLVRLNKKYYTRYVVCLLVSNSHSYTKHHQRKSRELWISKHSINLPRSTRKACSPICSNMSRVSSSFFFVLYKKFVIFFSNILKHCWHQQCPFLMGKISGRQAFHSCSILISIHVICVHMYVQSVQNEKVY